MVLDFGTLWNHQSLHVALISNINSATNYKNTLAQKNYNNNNKDNIHNHNNNNQETVLFHLSIFFGTWVCYRLQNMCIETQTEQYFTELYS